MKRLFTSMLGLFAALFLFLPVSFADIPVPVAYLVQNHIHAPGCSHVFGLIQDRENKVINTSIVYDSTSGYAYPHTYGDLNPNDLAVVAWAVSHERIGGGSSNRANAPVPPATWSPPGGGWRV